MDDMGFTREELIAALGMLYEKWDTRARESLAYAEKLRSADTHHAHYYQGISQGYQAALEDLRALLYGPGEADPAIGPEQYIPLDDDTVLAVLEHAGLAITDLHTHKDNTFSAVFAPLQVLSFEERIAKLTSVADVAILDYGRLPNSNKPYIDFAFRSPPE
jgi:hypothetical protein